MNESAQLLLGLQGAANAAASNSSGGGTTLDLQQNSGCHSGLDKMAARRHAERHETTETMARAPPPSMLQLLLPAARAADGSSAEHGEGATDMLPQANADGRYECERCDCSFVYWSGLASHRQGHCLSRSWACHWCEAKRSDTARPMTGPNGPNTLCETCGSCFLAAQNSSSSSSSSSAVKPPARKRQHAAPPPPSAPPPALTPLAAAIAAAMATGSNHVKPHTIVTPEFFSIHAVRAIRASYAGHAAVPPGGTVAGRAVVQAAAAAAAGGAAQQQKAARAAPHKCVKAEKPSTATAAATVLRTWSIMRGSLFAGQDTLAIFCHSSCGVRLQPTTTDAELEYLGTVNLLHKKWEVLLKALLRLKLESEMAQQSTAAKAALAQQRHQQRHQQLKKNKKRRQRKGKKMLPACEQQQQQQQQQQQPQQQGLAFVDFEATPDFDLTAADFELLGARFLAESTQWHKALAKRFLAEMNFARRHRQSGATAALAALPSAASAPEVAPGKGGTVSTMRRSSDGSVAALVESGSEAAEQEEPPCHRLSPDELAQLMAQTTGRMLQINSFLSRISAFVREGTADGSVAWNDERSCFITSRAAMEAKVKGAKGDIWRSLNMFAPFFTRYNCNHIPV